MATYTIDQIAITRTKTTLKGSDIMEGQIKDGGVDDEKSIKFSIDTLNGGATPLRYKCLLSQNAPIATTTDPTMVAGQIWTLEAYDAADATTIAALELISGTLYAVGSKYRSATNQTLAVAAGTTLSYDGSPYIVSTDVNGDFNPFINTTGQAITYSYVGAGQYAATSTGLFLINKTNIKPIQTSQAGIISKSIAYRNDNNEIGIETSNDAVDVSDDELYYTLFEFEIYP
jgi:hypothetical protein